MENKILLVYAKNTDELRNRKSALGSYIFCLCEILQKEDMQVFVNGIAFDELKKKSSQVTQSLPVKDSGIKNYIPHSVLNIYRDFIILKNVRNVFENINPTIKYDCVLEFYSYASDVGLKFAKTQNIPLIVVYDGPVLEENIFFNGNKLLLKNRILKRELKTLIYAKQIVAYSNSVKQYLNKITNKNLNVSIHQNVDFTRFDFIEKQFNVKTLKIGFIGSFLKWHRIDLLLNAFNRLKESGFSVELVLIGSGMEYEAIKSMAEKSKYSQFITMTGFLDGEQLLEVKKGLHIGVMPGSNWYGAPNKIFEYGAAKMAVIAPNTPTIADLFENEKNIILFKQDDEEDLYQKLKIFCDNLSLCEKLATSLQKKIRNNYNMENTSYFYNKLITNAISVFNK